MHRHLGAALAALLLLESAAAGRDVIRTGWSGFEKQVSEKNLEGRQARIELAGGTRVNTRVLRADATGLEVHAVRKVRKWATGEDRAIIPPDQVRSVRFKGRMGSRGRWIGALAGAAGGAAVGGAVAARNDVTEGPGAILIPAAAAAAVVLGLLIGYFIGRTADRHAPEFVIQP